MTKPSHIAWVILGTTVLLHLLGEDTLGSFRLPSQVEEQLQVYVRVNVCIL